MRQPTVAPTGVERTFDVDEIIVSKTDTKGIITYANEVFCRISGYREEEILGRPHNMVRHPEMPRAIFKLLWDTIGSGHEIFAYVVNLASDGSHYWVLAHVTPSFGADGGIVGYHSNRRCPDRGAVAKARSLYADLCAVERRHADPREAVAASTDALRAHLDGLGRSYDEMVWSITPEEVSR